MQYDLLDVDEITEVIDGHGYQMPSTQNHAVDLQNEDCNKRHCQQL